MIQPEDNTVAVPSMAKYMVGKTIKAIDETAANCLNIEFTDGTELLLEVESAGHGIYTNVGYIRKK